MSNDTPTTDQIRAAIDHGDAGDKIPHPDPATVPLGADAESAGTPATPEQRRLEASRLRPHTDRRIFADASGIAIYVAALIPLALIVAALVALTPGPA